VLPLISPTMVLICAMQTFIHHSLAAFIFHAQAGSEGYRISRLCGPPSRQIASVIQVALTAIRAPPLVDDAPFPRCNINPGSAPSLLPSGVCPID
jgi:hypothetical protein